MNTRSRSRLSASQTDTPANIIYADGVASRGNRRALRGPVVAPRGSTTGFAPRDYVVAPRGSTTGFAPMDSVVAPRGSTTGFAPGDSAVASRGTVAPRGSAVAPRVFIAAPRIPVVVPTVSRNSFGAEDAARIRFNKTRELIKTERKLVRSCDHVILLNDNIRGLTKRYQRARAAGYKSFRYNIRIRLAAFEGVRNMYYEYARDRAEEIAELRKELYDQNVEIITGPNRQEPDGEYDVAGEVEEAMDEED